MLVNLKQRILHDNTAVPSMLTEKVGLIICYLLQRPWLSYLKLRKSKGSLLKMQMGSHQWRSKVQENCVFIKVIPFAGSPSRSLFVLSFHHMIKLQTHELVPSFCFPCDYNDICHIYLQVLFFDSFISAFYISIIYSWSKQIVWYFDFWLKSWGRNYPFGLHLEKFAVMLISKWSLTSNPCPYPTCLLL